VALPVPLGRPPGHRRRGQGADDRRRVRRPFAARALSVYGYALMKTLTELSGSLIRVAAAAVAEAKRSLPAEEKPATTAPEAPAPAEAEGASPSAESTAAPVETTDAPPAAAASAETTDAPPAAAAAAPAETTDASPPGEAAGNDAVSAALDEAVAKATGLSGDRLSMLRAAVEVVGRRVEDVRLVRVFGAEEPIPAAKAIGGHQYVVDFFPQSMRQVAGGPKDERGGRRGGRGGRGGGGGGRGGGGGTKAGATGGFSMDSLREDRKNERGGRGRPGGGGRRPGGGGAPGSRGPGGRPGGDPKK
jgi:hypothetical protein